ncbi:LLM class flavin-dependent oxidoreductase [Allorhizocola rhizosphaerae]|uniref:LLM class flavin-dependent oxidoreductase n=1 Tax=Allorhizocola rhizosphaerae TaxID=1872709 RepID=UPI000E3C373D|nr:LLM class flavin-dependent oxidoreductase [Allorhizocola rhizosphaerae]
MQFTVYDITSATADGASAWRPVDGKYPHSAAYQHTLEQAQLADQVGLDTYFLTEHHFNAGFQLVPSPHLMIAAMSQLTSRIRLGAMTLNLPLYHPVRVAEEIRMLDVLTGGRLEIGLGRGLAGHEQAGFGVQRAESEILFDQSFALVRQLLAEGGASEYSTGPWHGEGVALIPEATQLPHPPIWMAGISEKSIRKAARLGVNLCTAFLDTADTTRTAAIYREEWASAHPDRPCGKYGTLQHIFVAETEEEARTYGQAHLEAWLNAGHEASVMISSSTQVDKGYEDHKAWFDKITRLPFDAAVDAGRIIFGTPQQCTEQLLDKAKAGVDMFQGWFQFGGLDFDASNRSMRLFGEHVAPAVKAALQPSATS